MSNSNDDGAVGLVFCALCLIITVFLILCTPVTLTLMAGSYASAGASIYGTYVSIDRVDNSDTGKNCSSAYTESGIIVGIDDLENGNYRIFIDLYEDGRLFKVGEKYTLSQSEFEKYGILIQKEIPMYQRCDKNCADARNDEDVYDCKHEFRFERQQQRYDEVGYIFLAITLIIAALVLIVFGMLFTVCGVIGSVFWTVVICVVVLFVGGAISLASLFLAALLCRKLMQSMKWFRSQLSDLFVSNSSEGDVETGTSLEEEESSSSSESEINAESLDGVDIDKSRDSDPPFFDDHEL